ncbi:MAG: lipocalin-like domain-containing protein [Gammaproteobacteria bacterium]|nr:lipocalin-like domain-containing protein [Gammaproteobacteria bacterium]
MYRLAWLLLLLLSACDTSDTEPESWQVAEALGGVDDAGFARATAPRVFHFPRDHGPHPAFRNEWWYLTGHLQTPDGRAYGYQVTLFRIAMQADPIISPSAWRSNQIWMGHAALSDLQAERHVAFERFARQGAGLAGGQSAPLRIWLEDWQLQLDAEARWQLRIATEAFNLDLELIAESPIILQGDQGLSQKSDAAGNASYYYSIPRLASQGTLRQAGEAMQVAGLSWLDREWSTSALGPEQAGWDWFSLHLQDGRNLMYYQLRQKDGSIDPLSAGSVSNRAGMQQILNAERIQLTPLAYWESDGKHYPVEWRMKLRDEPQPWRIKALFTDQEMRLSVRYWEGAIEVREESSKRLLGKGYLEMTGYE